MECVSLQKLAEILEISITELKNLKELYLGYNQLTSLPESFGKLVNLEELYLRNNQLTTLPESFEKLVNLKILSLQYNQLTTLPESFGKLVNLEVLSLHSNQLTTLPESFGKLVNLEVLYLQYNQFTTLPESFGNLENLKILYLQNNQLTSLPESIGKLTNLRYLYLQNNRLTILSSYMIEIRSRGTDLRINTLCSSGMELLEDENWDELLNFYKYSTIELCQNYVKNKSLINDREIERILHEISFNEREYLEANLSSKDPLIIKIMNKYKIRLNKRFIFL